MSRFTIQNSRGQRFVYGYDNRLQYYFLDQFRSDGSIPKSLVGLLSIPYVYGSAANLLEMCKRKKIELPQHHVDDLLCDLPLREVEPQPAPTVDELEGGDEDSEFDSSLDQWGVA